MKLCGGTLIVDDEGTPVVCSQEGSEGCSDHSYERHRVFLAAGSGEDREREVVSSFS